MSGTLFGVGTGPGDPELMTLKAVRVIASAKVVVSLSADAKPGLARTIAAQHIADASLELVIDMPMRVDPAEGQAAYDKAVVTIRRHLDAGDDVAFLCEGDPMFYGSFMYVLARLSAVYPVSIVPGIASPMAAAAMAKMPLCARDDAFAVIPAPLPDARIEALLEAADTAVIMKLGRHLPRIRALLDRSGLTGQTIYVERATMDGERLMRLGDLPPDAAPYFSLLLIARDPVTS
jgi:precorrin-2/cobalt-factor-2 C20-methyltransferase